MGWSARRQTCAARVFHPALGFVQVCPLSSLAFFSLHFAFDMLVSLCFFVAPSVSPTLSHILLACFALLRYFFFSQLSYFIFLPFFSTLVGVLAVGVPPFLSLNYTSADLIACFMLGPSPELPLRLVFIFTLPLVR